MNIFKEIKKLQSQSEDKKGDIHPFTIVKKEKGKLKKYIYFLLFLTFVLYGFIFYTEFFKKEKIFTKKQILEKTTKKDIDITDISKNVKKIVEETVNKVEIPEANTVEGLFKKSYEAYKKGNFTEALYYIKRILSKKDYIPAIILKAKIFEKEGLHNRARTILEETYYKYPEDKDIILNLGEMYEKEGALIVAKDMYKMLSDKGYIEGALHLAQIYEKLGEKEKALSLYKKLYKDPNIPQKIKEIIEKKIVLLGK